MKKYFRKVLLLIIAGSAFFIIFSFVFVYFFIASYHSLIETPPNEMNFEYVTFKTSDNIQLKGWLSKATDTSKTIILLHGYKTNRSEMIPKAKIFKDPVTMYYFMMLEGHKNFLSANQDLYKSKVLDFLKRYF